MHQVCGARGRQFDDAIAAFQKGIVMQIDKPNLTSKVPPPARPSHNEVASLAARKWEKQGRPSGLDTEIWLQAEQELLASRQAAAEKNPARTPAKPASDHPSPPTASPPNRAMPRSVAGGSASRASL